MSEDFEILRTVYLPDTLDAELAALTAPRPKRLPRHRKVLVDDLLSIERAIAAVLCDGLVGATQGRLERAWDSVNRLIGKPE